jgi:hypothetical protein
MHNELVPNQFKVSNTPALIRWNALMSIQDILDQMEGLYGKLSIVLLFATDTLFKSPFATSEATELLFYHIEQCQEVMTLWKLPYTSEQIIQNVLRLLMASNIFPVREFDTWEQSTVKIVPGPEDVHPRGIYPLSQFDGGAEHGSRVGIHNIHQQHVPCV